MWDAESSTPHWLRGERYQHFGARNYDPASCIFLQPDPLAEKYYGFSPYNYCAGDPVNLVDPEGSSLSTHTDAFGNIVAVYNDGDLGVYRHNGDREYTKNDLDKLYSKSTSAGGTKMGESVQIFSFATNAGDADTSIRIDFNSMELTYAVQSIIDAKPSLTEYMKNAQSKGIWDLKEQEKYKNRGSLLFGKYASPRDAGNFAAGYFSASRGVFSPVIDFGYGFYNISGNDKTRTCINASLFLGTPLPISSKGVAFVLIGHFGEDKISRLSQKAGKQYYRRTH